MPGLNSLYLITEERFGRVRFASLLTPESVIVATDLAIGIGAALLLSWYYFRARRRTKERHDTTLLRYTARREEACGLPLDGIPPQTQLEIAELRRKILQLEADSDEFWRQRGEAERFVDPD